MYEQHFGLTCRPFDLAPDPRFIFMTAQHSRAVANMKFALMNRDSFVIITGEIGIGKTTILNTVLEELGPDFVTAKLTHTTLSHIELLQALLSEFGMPIYKKKKVLLLDTLRAFFLRKHEEGKHVVIIVDEAQNLSGPALEELRLLSCIDTADRKIISIVLTGQPNLDDLLDAPGLTQLRQRARLRQRLDALNEEETLEYLRHRLAIAGGEIDAIFEPDAVKDVHRLTQGIPRLINTLCDTALTACMVENLPKVTLDVIDEVVHELRWQWFEERQGAQAAAAADGQAAAVARGGRQNRVMLMVYKDGQFVEQVQAGKFPFVIGRSNANDLVVIDKEVSRRHALVDCIGGIYVVEDLNSKNGILVNRKRRPRALLRTGDVISFGQVDVVFYSDRAAGRDSPAAPLAAVPDSPATSDTGMTVALPQVQDDTEHTARRRKTGILKLPS
ncbi:ABC transporter ATP-binding/permease protein [Gammaproteobacteria bacterium]|nr:ABC transporter ATP-binding/permease protein [Gammaproteobacteria bacterium]